MDAKTLFDNYQSGGFQSVDSCQKKCADPKISARNHYWDKKETPRFGEMMERYEHHMLFYQQLEESCELDFKIARRDHCD